MILCRSRQCWGFVSTLHGIRGNLHRSPMSATSRDAGEKRGSYGGIGSSPFPSKNYIRGENNAEGSPQRQSGNSDRNRSGDTSDSRPKFRESRDFRPRTNSDNYSRPKFGSGTDSNPNRNEGGSTFRRFGERNDGERQERRPGSSDRGPMFVNPRNGYQYYKEEKQEVICNPIAFSLSLVNGFGTALILSFFGYVCSQHTVITMAIISMVSTLSTWLSRLGAER